MAIVWTPERRAAHGAKIREARALGKEPVTGGSPLGKDIVRALEAIKIVDRIGWPLARTIAARIEEPT